MLRGLILVILALLAFCVQAAEPRVALVIGNAAYREGALANPVNDARDMRDQLLKLGFAAGQMVYRENLKRDEIGATLREFRNKLQSQPGAVGLVFYAGHGVQVRGENYFPAVDAKIDGEEDVPTQSLHMATLLEVLVQSKARVNLVFLDACRNNPYRVGFRSATRGLGRHESVMPSGTLIAYATRANAVASDGKGRNGTFTAALLEHMTVPGETVEQMFKRVVRSVRKASGGQQEPWSEGSLDGDFYFALPTDKPPAISPLPGAVPQLGLDELRREDERRRQWGAWQTRMRADFDGVQSLNVSADLQVKAWERFIAAWKEDNPTSPDDEGLRAQALLALEKAQMLAQRAGPSGGSGSAAQLSTPNAVALSAALLVTGLAAALVFSPAMRSRVVAPVASTVQTTWGVWVSRVKSRWKQSRKQTARVDAAGSTRARAAPPPTPNNEMQGAFEALATATTIEPFDRFLERYPGSPRWVDVREAREKMAEAKKAADRRASAGVSPTQQTKATPSAARVELPNSRFLAYSVGPFMVGMECLLAFALLSGSLSWMGPLGDRAVLAWVNAATGEQSNSGGLLLGVYWGALWTIAFMAASYLVSWILVSHHNRRLVREGQLVWLGVADDMILAWGYALVLLSIAMGFADQGERLNVAMRAVSGIAASLGLLLLADRVFTRDRLVQRHLRVRFSWLVDGRGEGSLSGYPRLGLLVGLMIGAMALIGWVFSPKSGSQPASTASVESGRRDANRANEAGPSADLQVFPVVPAKAAGSRRELSGYEVSKEYDRRAAEARARGEVLTFQVEPVKPLPPTLPSAADMKRVQDELKKLNKATAAPALQWSPPPRIELPDQKAIEKMLQESKALQERMEEAQKSRIEMERSIQETLRRDNSLALPATPTNPYALPSPRVP